MVNTKESFYKPHNIQFHGVQAVDLKSFPLAEYFHQAADWIEMILAGQGTVFVHCVQVMKLILQILLMKQQHTQGISRSATLVLAFLIIKKRMKLQDAIMRVKQKRSIAPNEGFMLQLIELNDDVHKLLNNCVIQK